MIVMRVTELDSQVGSVWGVGQSVLGEWLVKGSLCHCWIVVGCSRGSDVLEWLDSGSLSLNVGSGQGEWLDKPGYLVLGSLP